MSTREYQFVVGPETSTLPTVGTPTSSTDLITLGFAEENYLQGGSAVADITALKAVSSANRADKDLRFVESTRQIYCFEASSSASNDDDTVLQPSSGTGRWLKYSPDLLIGKANLNDGALTTPSLTFTNDQNTGIYRVGADDVAIVAGGHAGLEVKDNGSFANVGMGSAPSASSNYPVLIQRSNASTGTHLQISNPATDASSKSTYQLSSDNGLNTGEVSLFTSATATHAYAGRMTVRPSDSTAGLSLIGGDQATGDVRVYTGGDYASTGESVRFPADHSVQFMQQIASPSAPAAGSKVYFKADGKPYYMGTGGVETQFGSGSGGINYISANPDAETSTTGWTTYADAAGTSPVDGTGGSPNSTWTRSTSSPLRGTASFLWTKSGAANRQGEGVAYEFTTDAADAGQVLSVSFDYKIASGTYADGDLTAYIYDVTNAAVIQPAPYTILNASVAQRWQSTFQVPTTSTSYRLIVHTASTSTANYTVQFDNFEVGPQKKSYGPFISDSISYTPAITGCGTVSSVSVQYVRRGNMLKAWGRFTTGTVVASDVTIPLPSGLTVDTAISSLRVVGVIHREGSIAYSTMPLIANGGLAYVNVGGMISAGTASTKSTIVAQVGSIVFNNSEIEHFEFEVPIQGWSSGQLLSSDADTRVVAARYTGTASTLATSATVVKYSTSSYDTHAAYSTSTGLYTCPVKGQYRVEAQAHVTSSAGAVSNAFTVQIYKNGAAVSQRYVSAYTTTNVEHVPSIADVIDCNAGDTLGAYFSHNLTGSALTISNDTFTLINIAKLSGPSQIAASETVSARYTTAAGQSVPYNSVTIVDFGTKDFDSHGAVTTGGSWKFTAPASGLYQIDSFVIYSTTFTNGASTASIQIYKNGSAVSRYGESPNATAGSATGLQIHDKIRLLAGDYIDIRLYQNDSSPNARVLDTIATSNVVAINRVGNY